MQEKKRQSLLLPPELFDRIQAVADAEGSNVSVVIRRYITQGLNREGKNEK